MRGRSSGEAPMAARLSGGRGPLRAWRQRRGRMAGGATWKTAEGEVRATDVVGVEELSDRAGARGRRRV